jgi:hypothetical protein
MLSIQLVKRRYISLLFLCCSFNAYNQKIVTDHYKTFQFNVVIFPKEYKSFNDGDSFTPARQEVDDAESALRSKLELINKDLKNQEESPVIHRRLRRYNRQYFGYINSDGHKVLYISALWKGRNKTNTWLERYIPMTGGGSYFWQIKYNLSTKELTDLNVNGY